MKTAFVIAVDVSQVHSVLGGARDPSQMVQSADVLKQAREIVSQGAAFFPIAVLKAEFTDSGEFVQVVDRLFDARLESSGSKTYIPIPNDATKKGLLSEALNRYRESLERELNELVAKALDYYRDNNPQGQAMAGLRLVTP